MKKKLFLIMIFLVFMGVLFDINNRNHEYYFVKLQEKMDRIVLGESAPRGRILDQNGKVLVDNVGVLNVVYHKKANVSIEEELLLAEKLSVFVNNYSLSTTALKNYYLAKNNNGKNLITEEEWNLWEERKLNNDDIKELKWERITEEMLDYEVEEKKIIYLFTKMQEGYSFQDKIIFSDVTDDFVAQIIGLGEPSLSIKVSSKRTYPYGETLRSIFGSIGSIPKESLTYFNTLGYALNDKVGVSGLESEYETLLCGKKAKYYVNSDNSLTLLEEETPGEDLVLNLDIEVQLELERVMKEEMSLAKTKPSAKYFKEAYAMIGNPKTGGIIALTGLKILENNPQSIIDFKAGKDRALGFLVGQAMKETKGKANPKMLNEMFLEELKK